MQLPGIDSRAGIDRLWRRESTFPVPETGLCGPHEHVWRLPPGAAQVEADEVLHLEQIWHIPHINHKSFELDWHITT